VINCCPVKYLHHLKKVEEKILHGQPLPSAFIRRTSSLFLGCG
jgi:hypothetical protein